MKLAYQIRRVEIALMSIVRHICRVVNHNFPRPFDMVLRGRQYRVGAEVGVFEGEHAAFLMRYVKPEKLYLVDPYIPYNDEEKTKVVLEAAKAKAEHRLSGHNVSWLLKKSTEVKLENLDFVYIDGNHSHEAVKKDMNHWWSMVRKGGVMGGHDFHPLQPGVVRAVVEFAVENKLQLFSETPDWWFVKE